MWINTEGLGKSDLRKLQYIVGKVKMPKIKIKCEYDECMPTKVHRWDAGWDLKTKLPISIDPGETLLVHTGIIMEIPPRFCGMVFVRSSIGKKGITLTNSVGIIDSEYRGEIMCNLINHGSETVKMDLYDRFAQIVITPINNAELWQVTELSETGRGDGGFGSTNKTKEDLMKMAAPGFKQELENHLNSSSYIENKDITIPELIEENEKILEELSETGRGDGGFGSTNNSIAPDENITSEVTLLNTLTPAEYVKLKASSKLTEIYPEATGDMKTDLGI